MQCLLRATGYCGQGDSGIPDRVWTLRLHLLSHLHPWMLYSQYVKEKYYRRCQLDPSSPVLEKMTLKVKKSKPPAGYMTPYLHTSVRKEIFLRLL